MINVNDYYSPRIKIWHPNNKYKNYMNYSFMSVIFNCVTPYMENCNFGTEVLHFTIGVSKSIAVLKFRDKGVSEFTVLKL